MSDNGFDDDGQLPLFADIPERRSKLEKAFWTFHGKHPEVYEALCRHARAWRHRQHVRRIGIATVYEVARYTLDIERDDKGLKLNNNHSPYYARLIMTNEPDLKNVFLLRRQRIQATIGPKGDKLPPNEHIS